MKQITSENPEYEKYRKNWNQRYQIYPKVIALVETNKDIMNLIRISQKDNTPFSVRGGGHCNEPFSLIDKGIVIDQSNRKKISLDNMYKTVTIEAGVLAGELIEYLGNYDLVLPMGNSKSVGVVGLTLGGGTGYLSRQFGLTSDNLLRTEIILADKRVLTVDKDNYPDLFFALRGAGAGNFGVVTSMTFKTHSLKRVILYNLEFSLDQYEIINIWQNEIFSLPDSISTKLTITNKKISITGMCVSNYSEIKKFLNKFSKFVPVLSDVTSMTYIEATNKIMGTDTEYPYFKQKSAFFEKVLNKEVIRDLVAFFENPSRGYRSIGLVALGGKISNLENSSTAFPHREALIYMFMVSAWKKSESEKEELNWTENIQNMIEPYSKGSYANVMDFNLKTPLQKYYKNNLQRLIEVKKKYDPGNFFQHPHSLK